MKVYIVTYEMASCTGETIPGLGGIFKTYEGAYNSLPHDEFDFSEWELPEWVKDRTEKWFTPSNPKNESAEKMFQEFSKVEITQEEVKE